jgi:hypothetical protein
MAEMMTAVAKLEAGMRFEGEAGSEHRALLDASAKVGGHNAGFRPMELLLVGLAGCTCIPCLWAARHLSPRMNARGASPRFSKKARILMLDNEFRRPVCIDDAPKSKVCEWCGRPAIYQLTTIGGRAHNDEGFYCSECAMHYTSAMADLLNRVVTAESTARVS